MNNWGVLLALALAACAIDSDADPSNREPEPIARSCGPFGCMQNTASGPDGEVFDELDANGRVENAHGVIITSFTLRGGVPAKIVVKRDQLLAKDSTGKTFSGDALDDAVLVLAKDGVPAFQAIFQADTSGVAYWGGDTTQTAVVYDITVRRLDEHFGGKPACRYPPGMNEWPGGHEYAALVFTGDRYLDETHDVEDSVGSSWFNIACAGNYPAKLQLLRHTWAGGFDRAGVERWPTKLEERRTYLRAITADYWGDGRTFTRSGVDLFYGDRRGIYPAPTSGTREAIWADGRAVCLNRPRVADRLWVDPTGVGIPDCSAFVPWQKSGYVLTSIP